MTYLHTPGIRQDSGPEHIAALIHAQRMEDPHYAVAFNAGLVGTRSVAQRCESRSTANVYRMLATAARSLRYWSEGFDHDDEQANTWIEHFGKEVDELLAVLKARGE
jgi:hypothetical protein